MVIYRALIYSDNIVDICWRRLLKVFVKWGHFFRLGVLKSPIVWIPISFKNTSLCDKASEQNEIETTENIKTHDWVSQNVSMFKLNMDTWSLLLPPLIAAFEINEITFVEKWQSHVMKIN